MLNKNRVLIVDDEPMNVHMLEECLKVDYEVSVALNGYEAIRQIKEVTPDLILLDIMMPDLSGYDVCKLIKSEEMFSAIPVIFLTAMDTIDAETEGFEVGGIDFLTKPFNSNLLKLRIRNHLELKRQHDLILEQRNLLTNQKAELEETIARIKQLEGIIPICMYCKNIRKDDSSWQRIENYICEHTDALFSHGICPSCFEKKLWLKE